MRDIRNGCDRAIELEIKSNKQKVLEKKQALEEMEHKLFAVEEKWINNEITKETYDRWYST